MSHETLSGHTSPETAVVVDDYPYGFRLRCQIRYWLEYKKGKGFRFVSQTSNPKKPALVWNKPKASTYQRLAGVMLRNTENGHITWSGLNEYADAEQCRDFLFQYGAAMPAEAKAELETWARRKTEYEQHKANGLDYVQAAHKVFIDEVKGADDKTV